MLCPEQFSLVRVQLESASGHPANHIDDALLEPSGCHGDVFTAAVQVQLRVIGKRVKGDIVCTDSVLKIMDAGYCLYVHHLYEKHYIT